MSENATPQPLRVLLYSWAFWPMVGGLERLTEQTARYLLERGHRVTVVTAALDGGGATDLPFPVERRPGLRHLIALVRMADIVQLNTFSARCAAVALALRKPIVWQHIDFDTISPRGICHARGAPCDGAPARCYPCLRRDHSRLQTWRALASLLLKRLAAPVVAANAVSTTYAQGRMRLPRAALLPFGIVTSESPPAPRPAPPPLRVLFFGRHVPAKGCDVLVRAAAICRQRGIPVLVRIAGDGPHRAASEALAAELGVASTVTFLGVLDQPGLDGELARAHVVVAAPTQDEIGAYVLWEGMAAGCAVVASDIGALPEHVGDGGLLFRPGDAEALADRLALLAGDHQLVERLAGRGRQLVCTSYDWRRMGADYERLYRMVVDGRSPGEAT